MSPVRTHLRNSQYFFDPLLQLFNFGEMTNEPDYPLTGIISFSGRLKVTRFAGPSCVVLLGELQYRLQYEGEFLTQMLVEDGMGTIS
jgi:hypothetical protein